MKWEYILNIDTISFIFIIVAILYCLYKNWGKANKHSFQGLGESGWDISEGKKYWNYNLPYKKEKKTKSKKNKHEERCRDIFQEIYRYNFKSIRPDWLKNPVTNKNLELDGYCEHIKTPIGKGLAFEYDGIQHSKYNKHFHRNGPDEFVYQTTKDFWKDKKCKEEGVMLIRIPHFVAYEDLERYIRDKLKKYKVYPSNADLYDEKISKTQRFDPSVYTLTGIKGTRVNTGLYG